MRACLYVEEPARLLAGARARLRACALKICIRIASLRLKNARMHEKYAFARARSVLACERAFL